MKYQITNEELNDYIKLAELRRKNPCRECKLNKSTCTGCHDYYDWERKMTNLKVEECPAYINDYVEATLDVEQSNIELLRVKKKREAAIEKLSSFKDIVIT